MSQKPVTADELIRWQALADAATEGPWRVEQGTDVVWGACDADDMSTHGMGHPIACGEPPYWAWQQGQPSFAERVRNANLSAEAREALPRLIARVRDLEAENTTLRALVQCNPDWKCPYGQTVAHIAECPHGFPGCACADDRMTIMMGGGEAKG